MYTRPFLQFELELLILIFFFLLVYVRGTKLCVPPPIRVEKTEFFFIFFLCAYAAVDDVEVKKSKRKKKKKIRNFKLEEEARHDGCCALSDRWSLGPPGKSLSSRHPPYKTPLLKWTRQKKRESFWRKELHLLFETKHLLPAKHFFFYFLFFFEKYDDWIESTGFLSFFIIRLAV